MSSPQPLSKRLAREACLGAAFVALSLVLTWPLGAPGQALLPDIDDSMFSVWRLAWIAHQLPNAPRDLFDANIFWPERNTLAFSDAMLLPALAGAPLIWLGVHPIVVHNVLLVAAFATAGYATTRLVRWMTGSVAAGMVGGVIFAFGPYRFAHIGHLELLWTAFIPLALLALYRLLERPDARRGAALGTAVALQGLCSVYYVVFLSLWLIPAALLAPLHRPVRPSLRHVLALAVAGVVTVALLGPYMTPYTQARADLGSRAQEVQRYSATPADYLRVADSNRVYPDTFRQVQDERSLFVGTIALALAAISVVLVRSRTALVYLALGLVAFDLSLGVNGMLYPLLLRAVPPLESLRAPARFGAFVLLAAAVLASLAVARLLDSASARRRWTVSALLIAGLVVEYWSAPVATRQLPLEPLRFHAWLASQPPTVVLELPVPRPDRLWGAETWHQYFSIYHWQPLANGYSGFAPLSYLRLLEALRRFPTDAALEHVQRHGVELLVLHEQHLGTDEYERLLEVCDDARWFSEARQFEQAGYGRIAACRMRPAAASQ